MEISTQDYGYSSSKTTSTSKVISNSEFESYLQEQLKTKTSNDEVSNVKNDENSPIQIRHSAGTDADGNTIFFPKEIEDQLADLQKKHIETKDPKYMFMQTEIIMQYNAYQNGSDVDSMFVVGKDGQFNWTEKKATMTNNDDVDSQKFVDKMLDIFIEKLGNSSGDLKDKYQDLVDNYQQMKDQIETNKTNSYRESSFYA